MTMRTPDDLHDARFDDAWRRASRETPPAALDDAIRAAARREVGAGPQDVTSVREATRPERWWFPLAAAATIGAIAIGLLQISTSDRVGPADERRVVSDVPEDAKPAPPAAEPLPSPQPSAPLAKEQAPPLSAPIEEPKSKVPREAKTAAGAAAPTPPPVAAPAAPPRPATAASSAPRVAVEPAPPPGAAPAPAPAVRSEQAQRPEPQPQPFPAPQKRDQAPSADVLQPRATLAPKKSEAAPQAPAVAQSRAPARRMDATEEADGDVRTALKSRLAAAPADRGRNASNSAAGTIAAAPLSEEAVPRTPPVAAPPMSTPQRAAAQLSAERSDSVGARAKQRAAMPIADWITLMRRLREEQRFDDLATELAAFRSLHADANTLLPQDLRDLALPAAGTR